MDNRDNKQEPQSLLHRPPPGDGSYAPIVPNSTLSTPDPFASSSEQGLSLETSPELTAVPEVVVVYRRQSWRMLAWMGGFGLLIALLLGAAFFFMLRQGNRLAPVRSGSFDVVQLPLGQVAKSPTGSLSTASTVQVNGRLAVSQSVITPTVIVSPTLRPAAPATGQIYYDKDTNQLSLYNGTAFISLGGSIQNTTNVTNLISAAGGSTTATLSAVGGTPGVIPKFIDAQNLGPSIITDRGSSVSVAGDLDLVSKTTELGPELKLWPENPTPANLDTADVQSVELGVKFRTDVSGFIKGLRYYKGPNTTGTHVGHLWSGSGTSLATATFTGETATGWQEVRFAAPVAIAAETTYVASYHTDIGHYAYEVDYFDLSDRSNASLHAPRSGEDGPNGVFTYSLTPAFPGNGFNATNYWVDVIFQPNPTAAQYKINGVPIASSDLSNNNDLAKRGASQVFTGNNTFRSAANSANAFSIQNSVGLALLQADTASERLYVGPAAGHISGVILVLGNRLSGGDPLGVEGAIYYNQDRHTFRCYRYGAWGACADLEVESGFSLYDEFMGGQVSSFGTNGIIGSLGWNAVAIGANGTLSFNPATPTPEADRPGVLALQTPAVANQGTTFMLGTASAPSMVIQTANTVKTAVAISSATGQVVRIGLHTETSSTTEPVSGVWWEADPAVDARWRYCYGNGTAAVCQPSTVNIAADTWSRLEIRVLATGAGTSRMEFGINGLFYTVNNATLDIATRVSPAFVCYTTTSTARSCYWDYFQVRGGTSNNR